MLTGKPCGVVTPFLIKATRHSDFRKATSVTAATNPCPTAVPGFPALLNGRADHAIRDQELQTLNSETARANAWILLEERKKTGDDCVRRVFAYRAFLLAQLADHLENDDREARITIPNAIDREQLLKSARPA